ncbi:hypothetical protein DFH01_17975 [Falsiroseomonas bella]|uniref:Uncharacterized protein n=1 Tax=Falsiroseomonas bella TaxID=2184016 RepID=A0A317F9Q3_9PROT|nr:hypothetical protein [Falsiroseomonas bella]PWS35495.1 hypothetical protein DFH01_17975 [Falsiroseomonas bella]
MRTRLLLILPLLAACTAVEPLPRPPQEATLPASIAPNAPGRDPIVMVGQSAGSFFRSNPPNQPAAAARAFAELEWLATAVPNAQNWSSLGGQGLQQLALARNQARDALAIPRDAPPQEVINGLAAASQALAANDRAALDRALPQEVFTAGPAGTVQRLSAPPRVPSALAAADTFNSERSRSSPR